MKNKTKVVVQTSANPENGPWKAEYSRVNKKKARHYGTHHRKEKYWHLIEVEI